MYYHRPAASLTAVEAALLAGAIVNPRKLNPAHPSKRLLRRQQIILKRMQTGPPAGTRKHAEPRLEPKPEEEKLEDEKPDEQSDGNTCPTSRSRSSRSRAVHSGEVRNGRVE